MPPCIPASIYSSFLSTQSREKGKKGSPRISQWVVFVTGAEVGNGTSTGTLCRRGPWRWRHRAYMRPGGRDGSRQVASLRLSLFRPRTGPFGGSFARAP